MTTAISRWSRCKMCTIIQTDDGFTELSDYEPYTFRVLPDTTAHVVKPGDTYHSLASKFYGALDPAIVEPSSLWWAIADFQPEPSTIDATVALVVGSIVFVPGLRTLQEEILSDKRRGEFL